MSRHFVSMDDLASMSFDDMRNYAHYSYPSSSHRLMMHALPLDHMNPESSRVLPHHRLRQSIQAENNSNDLGTYESLLALDDTIQRRGISKKTKSSLTYRAPRREEVGTECNICKEPYRSSSKVVSLPCRHVFHYDCIHKWLVSERTCPCCRYLIEK